VDGSGIEKSGLSLSFFGVTNGPSCTGVTACTACAALTAVPPPALLTGSYSTTGNATYPLAKYCSWTFGPSSFACGGNSLFNYQVNAEIIYNGGATDIPFPTLCGASLPTIAGNTGLYVHLFWNASKGASNTVTQNVNWFYTQPGGMTCSDVSSAMLSFACSGWTPQPTAYCDLCEFSGSTVTMTLF
jgi:hypothetical protein